MSVVDFLNIPGVANPQLSPNGNQFTYEVFESNWKENKQIRHIWRADVSGDNQVKLTNSEDGESNACWSPDGTRIAFLSKRSPNEENQIYIISNSGGEAWQLTRHKTAPSNIQWSRDGQSLYFMASEPKTKDEESKEKLKDDVYAYDENFKLRHLWRIGLKDTAVVRITEGEYSVNNYRLSGWNDKVVITRSISPLFNDSDQNELWMIDADGQNQKQLTNNRVAESSAELSPDGNQVLFVANANENFDFYYNDKLFVIPTQGGTPKLLTKAFPYEVNQAHWAKDGKSIYLLANTGLESQLFNLSLGNGKWTQITQGDQAINWWNYNANLDVHLFDLNNATNGGDIHTMKGVDKKTIRKVTKVYDYFNNDFKLPRQERVKWKGADGVEVEGLLFYPVDYEVGKKYPLVVQTHGGPASADHFGISRSFTEYHPVLAGKGYMVLQPNYRGSTGYGDDFLRDMVGSYFKNAHLDVMAGVDYLIGKGLVDSNRMVKMGWSAGGHMTNKIITFTDRFKAASSGAGAANWVSMYAQSDVRIYRTPWFGGTPWQKNAPIEKYWDNSPLKDVHNVKTPTIFEVGGSDPRVPYPQSVEMYQALKSNGVPTHLYVAPREPHGWQELRHRLYKINVELEWFAKYALGENYQWEKAPEKQK
ncbi:MAG: S9 family peptidase [Cyclobacteriaceae bacterium]|nr:S9 family peptidase [Cyclobacteriaceae bacterium]